MLLDTPVCDFGWPAPDFSLKTPEGEVHSRDSLMGENELAVAFICNHCPYVIAVIDRLVADAKTLQDSGVGVAFIMSNDYNDYPADAPDVMTKFASKHGMTAPYLVDEDQTVGRSFGATCSPDFFGFDRNSGLQYRGRLDNVGMRGDPTGRVPELLNAMALVAETGAGPTAQTPSMGCSIKWR